MATSLSTHVIKIKRIYAPQEEDDGCRILADRLWPRGIPKERAGLSSWVKNIAPSAELRKSFAHRTERFDEFRKAYIRELEANPEAVPFVKSCETELLSCNVTLLYAAKDETCNNAAVLREWIQEKMLNGTFKRGEC